jgi:hypothetical protein
MSEYISNSNSVEIPSFLNLKLNSSQLAEVKKFLGQGNQDLLKLENGNLPKAIGLINVGENGKFECNLLISKPLIYGSKWENGKLFVSGKSIAKTDSVIFFIQQNGKIETVETTAQNAMLYAHAGNGSEKNGQEISGVFWIDSDNGKFEIPINIHQIPNALLNGVKIRSTLFTGVNLENKNKIDCTGKSGIINQNDKDNIGQRSEFSQTVRVEIPPVSPILQTSFWSACLIVGIIAIKKIRKL